MEEKLYLCLENEIAEFSSSGARHTPFSGAAALCAGKQSLYCADCSGALWRFDQETMVEQAVGSGGPGVCDMCLSEGDGRLFSLVGDADSILMSDAATARPLAVNRCGCNPQNLSLCADCIAVSGGESAQVYLFNTHSLECVAQLRMPGAVCSVLLGRDAVYALCMTSELNAVFVICRGTEKRVLPLEGMPGCLCALGENVLVAVRGRQYLYSSGLDCLIGMGGIPGKPVRICLGLGKVFMLDSLSERVFASQNGLPYRTVCAGVKGMMVSR